MKTTFGGLLTQFQRQKKLAFETARRELLKRNKGIGDHKLVESSIVTTNGDTVHSVELWKKVDEEHVRISTKVEAETIQRKQAHDEMKELLK